MPTIFLVCSAHRPNGACNAAELLEILRALEPEVVFEEIRPSDFESYCKHGRLLEAQALAKYQAIKSCKRVAVDRFEMLAELLPEAKDRFDRLFGYVEYVSADYRRRLQVLDDNVNQRGFSYLNSPDCSTARTTLCAIEDNVVRESGESQLILWLEEWRQFVQSRDRGMVDAIYEYCRGNDFKTGVFLVGAAHKAGLVEAIEACVGTEPRLIEWKHWA